MNSTRPLGSGDPRRLGRYAILSRIGGGGMGVVYLGQAPDRRLVAVKVVRSDRANEPELVARFRREVRAASGVAGFCTARVLDADLDARQPYYVTEYVEGPTLQEAVEEGGPLGGARLEAFAIGVAEALEAIHAAGVVHRDLKPSNVLLSPAGPRVIDFGIARPLDATTLTQAGKVIGSVNWLAPEQLRTGKASEASDVFAWGGLVAFAASGRPPFGLGGVGAIAQRILHEAPDVRGLRGALRETVQAALDKDPARRPTARGLLERLVGGADPDPVTAATEVVQRTWMFPRVPAAVATPPPTAHATPPMASSGAAPPPDRPVVASRVARHGGLGPDRGAPDEPGSRGRDGEEHGRGARQAYARGTVLADLVPGGLLRDLALVAAFGALIMASLASDEPVSSTRITAPALVALVGAAMLGRNRAASGFVLGTVGLYVLGRAPTTALRTVLGYFVLLVAIGIVGTIAAFGRRHKTIGAVVALVIGFVVLQVFLTSVSWDNFHLPHIGVGPLKGLFHL